MSHVIKFLVLRLELVMLKTRMEIAHIRDSNRIGQLHVIRSCLRQGCGYADFDNKRR